ncbi:hypothetical protein PFISCL1PPCAC_12189, partial [Pristionchus fissidentatus]
FERCFVSTLLAMQELATLRSEEARQSARECGKRGESWITVVSRSITDVPASSARDFLLLAITREILWGRKLPESLLPPFPYLSSSNPHTFVACLCLDSRHNSVSSSSSSHRHSSSSLATSREICLFRAED